LGECRSVGGDELRELAATIADELGEKRSDEVGWGVAEEVRERAEAVVVQVHVARHDEQGQF